MSFERYSPVDGRVRQVCRDAVEEVVSPSLSLPCLLPSFSSFLTRSASPSLPSSLFSPLSLLSRFLPSRSVALERLSLHHHHSQQTIRNLPTALVGMRQLLHIFPLSCFPRERQLPTKEARSGVSCIAMRCTSRGKLREQLETRHGRGKCKKRGNDAFSFSSPNALPA
jgi:hypothetical protein